MQTLQLSAKGTSQSANAIAQVVVPNKTSIKAIEWTVAVSVANGSGADSFQLSRASASEIGVNGAQQVISNVAIGNGSNGSPIPVTIFHPVSIPVTQGQILYLHTENNSSNSYDVSCILHY